ncbi:MAG: DUF4416 family protein [Candidatus Omnitrophota bacterium]
MGKITKPQRVKLIVGFIAQPGVIDQVSIFLAKKFGALDYQSAVFDFDFTDYYTAEMGEILKRQFVSFQKLIRLEVLADIKIFTNNLENKFLTCGRRRINIDPGAVNLAKLILLTTKDYAHRIYIGKGIYAEVTLCFKNKTFTPCAWTYPDYRTQKYIEIFNNIRQIYGRQLDGEGRVKSG